MDRRPWRERRALDDVLVACAALVTFGVSLAQPLVPSWDDGRFLQDFAPVQSIGWANFMEIVGRTHFDAYHPVHLLSYWIDVPWFGPSGPILHGTNLVLWCVALFLARRVFVALGLSRGAALAASLAFGLHPVQVEAVAWATGRKDVLAACFAFGALLVHLRATGVRRHVGVSVLYVLAILSKTSVLPLPLLLFAIDVMLCERKMRPSLLAHLPMAALGGAIGILVVVIWSDHEMVRAAPEGLAHLQLVGATLGHYLGTAIAPLRNSPLYEIHRGSAGYDWADLVPLLGIAAGLAMLKGRPRFVLVAFVLLLLPVLNLVPVYWEKQDRYLSFALCPLAYGAGLAFDWAQDRRALLSRVVVVTALALLALRTGMYVRAWNGDMALWTHATQVQPRAYYAWINLGQGERDAGRYGDAREAYESARALQPTMRLSHTLIFEAHVLEDERALSLRPSRSEVLAARFDASASDVERLRALAGDMVAAGYQQAALVPLARSLDLAPLDDERLKRAAASQLAQGREWLARFYVSRMSEPPQAPGLSGLGTR